MRAIELRAWDKKENCWIEGVTYTLHTSGRLLTYESDIELTEWTGLSDRNGQKIYEGDIVRSFPWGLSSKPLIEAVSLGEQEFLGEDDYQAFCQGYNLDPRENYEVIGNIYENSDLPTKG